MGGDLQRDDHSWSDGQNHRKGRGTRLRWREEGERAQAAPPVDTTGSVIRVVVHEANAVDRDGAKLLLVKVGERLARMRRVWAGRGYNGKLGE